MMRRVLLAAAGGSVFVVVVVMMPDTGASTKFMSACEGKLGNQIEVIAAAPTDAVEPEDVAHVVVSAGQKMSMTPSAIQAALAGGLAQSGLKVLANTNIPESLSRSHAGLSSDANGLGIFRLTPQFGSPATLMDPTQAAAWFFNKLTAITNWRALQPSEAAARVLGGSDHQYASHRNAAERYYQRYHDPATTSLAAPTPIVSTTATPTMDELPEDAGSPSAIASTDPYSANPFASLTIPPDAPDIVHQCASALSAAPVAPLVDLPRRTSIPGQRAATAAAGQVGIVATSDQSGTLNGPASYSTLTTSTRATTSTSGTPQDDKSFDETTLVRWAIYQGTAHELVLPETVPEMNKLGIRIGAHDTVAGDLVFTDFTDEAPPRVRIAIDGQRVIQALNGRIVVAPMPTGNVVIKRLL